MACSSCRRKNTKNSYTKKNTKKIIVNLKKSGNSRRSKK